MAVPRQEGSAESGRVNQKRRTRAAIVDAAKALMEQGVTPTVAQAAEEALVSRTTAYRYFPTQESLLLEVAVNVDVDDLEALVGTPVDAAGAPDRAREILARFNQHVLDDEVRYRAAMRLYLDQWLAAAAEGETTPVVREGRRKRWLTTTLAPLAGTVPAAELDRLVSALTMLTGPEAMVALRDIAQLDGPEAQEVAAWVAQVVVEAVLGAGHDRGRT